eukprot:Protomagalhaensia_sp_Gyna_25__5779@NODE_845_length_2517_cov_82_781275_g666_i0_p2_GENE_NODE_845_length_2517_cov_82_781275_g666_i0NODE_845_length_2517_cov_82_781275_g666_i0_p2_ORF_typecomplete_len331_score61_66Actin/PF00022_19/7_5e68MreB_Mbl/PF06723_13/2_2e12PilM_2/PF11104_8/1_1e03PilM_2/PF11104_8/1_5e05Filo_VP24/PF06389_11/0_053FtsA/PF14450_6/0_22_NODE_845_length_2517_cov_82_781275_g666_i012612253
MPAIVIDHGSQTIKAGLGDGEEPGLILPSAALRRGNSWLVGPDAIAETNSPLTRTIVQGQIKDWSALEALWSHVFRNLRNGDQQPVLLTQTLLAPKLAKERMVQSMFETFEVPAVGISLDAVLALYSAGRTGGLVLGSGSGLTTVVPIREGAALRWVARKLPLAGDKISEWLAAETGLPLAKAESTKEKYCYVATETGVGKPPPEQPTSLPDGTVLGPLAFMAPEQLLPEWTAAIRSVVTNSETDLRADLYSNIVLAGGNTLFTGMPERVTTDLTSILGSFTVNVLAAPERQHASWIGGAILTTLSTFTDALITKEAYQESGPSVAHRHP